MHETSWSRGNQGENQYIRAKKSAAGKKQAGGRAGGRTHSFTREGKRKIDGRPRAGNHRDSTSPGDHRIAVSAQQSETGLTGLTGATRPTRDAAVRHATRIAGNASGTMTPWAEGDRGATRRGNT